jgi:hypothetical protein
MEGWMPASARRWVNRIAVYWVDSTGCRNTLIARSCDGSEEASSSRSCGSLSDAVAWTAAGRAP